MKVLIVGSGKGAWVIRGQQLGSAIGARVLSQPSEADVRWADVVVLIKRAGLQYAPLVHALDRPLVWDALDFWSQPRDNRLVEGEARALLARTVKQIRPMLTIGATQAMAEACGGVYLPHHSWVGLKPTPQRARVEVVAYQGNPSYLGDWRLAVQRECDRRGWRFVINPTNLHEADLIVALREGQWDGWMPREWKSGVKLANALAAGRPVITQDTAAFREMHPYGSAVESAADLSDAMERWSKPSVHWTTDYYNVADVAAEYRALLGSALNRRAA